MSPQSLAVPSAPPPSEDDQFTSSVWRKRYDKRPLSSNAVVAILDVEYNELAQSWKRFQDSLPSEDHVEFQERAQIAEDVFRVVQNVQTVWMSSSKQRLFMRSMALCDKFLSTLDPHSMLLVALPKNEFYVSLFYGVLQSILKVVILFLGMIAGMANLAS
ncbi:hypothetical protein EYZ11_007665 [Aspergillus tanneri]|uniref:Uncharacterized protein n=1 Tax=Aspergillus tanneri TaxID=1220188 RepID=A0A4S3JCQ0_9EURO|nr:hypothetical protein EYZ11_007665 [Aspergillus tanneri]